MADLSYRYKVFLSYSHASDRKLAPALQTALHRFARPWSSVRALRMFRDESSLSTNPDLWFSIQNALRQSEFFILLASPQAAASQWVSREVEFWRLEKPVEKLLIVLTDGEISWNPAENDFDWTNTTALPRALQKVFPQEPLHADLRWARSVAQLSLVDPRFRGAVADLAATLHGRSKDDLIGEDISQHRRLTLLRRTAVAALCTLGVGFAVAGILAYGQRNSALIAQSRYLADLSKQRLALGDTSTAILLAREALPPRQSVFNRPVVPEAESALHSAVLAHRQLASPAGHRDAVTSIVFSADGQQILTASRDKTARVWDAHSGKPISILEHDRPVSTAVYCGSTHQVATVSDEATMRIWKSENKKSFKQVSELAMNAEKTGSWAWLEHMNLWFATNFLSRLYLPGDDRSFEFLAVSSDCQRVLSQSLGGEAAVWNATTGAQLARLGDPLDTLLVATLDTQDAAVITRSRDDMQHIWDATTGAHRLALKASPVQKGDNETWVASLIRHVSALGNRPIVFDEKLFADMSGIPYVVGSFAPNGHLIAISANQSVRLLDRMSGREVAALHGHREVVTSIAFSPDSARAVTASIDGVVQVWAVDGGKLLHSLRHAGPVPILDARFSPDGETLMTVGGQASLWNVQTGQLIAKLQGLAGEVIIRAAFSPDSRLLATATTTGEIRVWSTQDDLRRTAERVVMGHSGTLTQAFFAADGRRIVTASAMGVVRISDLETGKLLTEIRPTLDGASNGLLQVDADLSRDGRRLLLLAHHKGHQNVELWDVESGSLETTLDPEPRSSYLSAKFGPDGKVVFLRKDNGVIAVDPKATSPARRIDLFPRSRQAFSSRNDVAASLVLSDTQIDAYVDTVGADVAHCKAGTISHSETRLAEPFVAVSDAADAVVVGMKDGALHLFTGCASLWGPTHRVLKGHAGAVDRAVFGPHGRLLTTSPDGARLWDYRTGSQLAALAFPMRSGTFSPDGRRFVTDQGIFWDMEGAVVLESLPLPILFDPSGARNEKQSGRWRTEYKPAWRIEWSPDGRRVIASGADAHAYVFRVYDLEELGERARKLLAGQELTQEQRTRYFID